MRRTFRFLRILAILLIMAAAPALAQTAILPDAQFAVGGGVINPGNSKIIFQGSECSDGRVAFVEFGLGFGAASSVALDYTVFDFGFSSIDPTQTWDIAIYAADGAANVSDCGAGTYLTSQSMPPGTLTPFVLDVTDQIAQLQAANATHIGFRFYNINADHSNFGQLALRGPGFTLIPVLQVVPADTEAPTWTVPGTVRALATGLDGASVDYPAPAATDNVGVESASCDANPGDIFPVGTTTVTCTASDAQVNIGTASFDVIVVVNESSITTLIDEIAGLNLDKGVTSSLQAPLHQAERLLTDGNPDDDVAVCNKLDSFLDHVQDRLVDGNLTKAQADSLTEFAEAIQASLGCR